MPFIDYEKVFDSIETSAVTKALRKQREEEIYMRII